MRPSKVSTVAGRESVELRPHLCDMFSATMFLTFHPQPIDVAVVASALAASIYWVSQAAVFRTKAQFTFPTHPLQTNLVVAKSYTPQDGQKETSAGSHSERLERDCQVHVHNSGVCTDLG
jgi:hypothetical protein